MVLSIGTNSIAPQLPQRQARKGRREQRGLFGPPRFNLINPLLFTSVDGNRWEQWMIRHEADYKDPRNLTEYWWQTSARRGLAADHADLSSPEHSAPAVQHVLAAQSRRARSRLARVTGAAVTRPRRGVALQHRRVLLDRPGRRAGMSRCGLCAVRLHRCQAEVSATPGARTSSSRRSGS